MTDIEKSIQQRLEKINSNGFKEEEDNDEIRAVSELVLRHFNDYVTNDINQELEGERLDYSENAQYYPKRNQFGITTGLVRTTEGEIVDHVPFNWEFIVDLCRSYAEKTSWVAYIGSGFDTPK